MMFSEWMCVIVLVRVLVLIVLLMYDVVPTLHMIVVCVIALVFDCNSYIIVVCVCGRCI